MYCTQCGRPLPSNGICRKCAKLPPGGAAHPLGKTVYEFCNGPAFLVLTLAWTLAGAWAGFCVLRVSPLPAPLFIPCALFCLGLWITFFSRRSRWKRAGLGLTSGALLAIITLVVILLAALCLICFYGIFLSGSDREYHYLVPSFLKRVLVFFLLMPVGVLFLNKLRKIVRTAWGVLRGNRGMAICPVSSVIFCLVFAVAGGVLTRFSAPAVNSFQLINHALSRLPFVSGEFPPSFVEQIWQWMVPVLLGFSAALLVTGIILAIYRIRLQRAKRDIVRTGASREGKKADAPVSV